MVLFSKMGLFCVPARSKDMKKLEYFDNKNICHRHIREARLRLGYSQAALAAKMQVKNINIDQQMISRVENNKRIVTDYELACFCDVLDLDINQVLQDRPVSKSFD